MKYRVQFEHSWNGQWEFEANHDVGAWNTANKYIKDHTQSVYVSIKEIYEIDENKKNIRKLPPFDQCEKSDRAKNVKQPRKEKPKMFIAHFNDGQCTGPYLAKDDESALEIGKYHAKFHAENNKISVNDIKITAIDEIEMYRPDQKRNEWYIKTPLTTIRAVNVKV